jgi:tRNA (guanine-N7-)-methyltransferase
LTAPVRAATAGAVATLDSLGRADLLDRLLPGAGPWELEIGFGKGRYLLARAADRPERRFLGIEIAGEYFRLAARRLGRRRLANVALLHGEALYLLASGLPRGFAAQVHVYFPDPWPKARHARRRLFSPASVDLVLAALAPGGRLCFATDFLDYGREVAALLESCPGLAVTPRDEGWPEGPRTNYEAKYVAEGRPILRLEAVATGGARLHPDGVAAVVSAFAGGPEPGADE